MPTVCERRSHVFLYVNSGSSWKVTTRRANSHSGGCHGNVAAKWTWLFCGCESLLLVNKNTTGKSYSAGVQDFIFHPLLLFYFRKKIIEKRLISPFLFSFLHEIQNKKPLAAVYDTAMGFCFSILINIFKQTCQPNIRYFIAST